MKCIIFDIDGTIANCEHRLHYIEGKNKNWQLFYDKCLDDSVITQVSCMIDFFKQNYKIILLTGRPESNLSLTVQWLNNNNIYFDELIMRKNGDYRKSPEYKKENICSLINEGFEIFAAFEDRTDCVEMLKQMNIFVFNVANTQYENI